MARCSADHQIRLRERGYPMSMIGQQFTGYMMLIAISSVIWTSKDAEAKTAVSHSCGADAYEPNNRRSRARNLSYELKHDREITAHLCRRDPDWYTVWLNQGELVEFHVTTPLERPPQIKVFAPRKRKPKGIARRLSPEHRQVRVYAQRSGRYRVLISGKYAERTQYQLSLRRSTPPHLRP